MHRYFINTIMLLLLATAVLSCSPGMAFDMMEEADSIGRQFPVEISGHVTDIDTGEALEEIRITVHANKDGETFQTKTVYTGNDGKFSIVLQFDSYATTIVAIADDLNGKYAASKHEILVSWNEIYSVEGVFRINGCDFHLKKNE